jgi:hypothetical protein
VEGTRASSTRLRRHVAGTRASSTHLRRHFGGTHASNTRITRDDQPSVTRRVVVSLIGAAYHPGATIYGRTTWYASATAPSPSATQASLDTGSARAGGRPPRGPAA